MSHGLVSSRIFLGAYIMYKVFRTRNLFLVKGVIVILPLMTLL
jgi:NADH:ubiquinone oxidoreductase subunit 4 (subunit M)